MRQRITAAILALVLVVFSIPVNEIACWAETIPENTEIKVKVTELDGTSIESGISFYENEHSGETLQAIYDNIDEMYLIDISGLETDDLDIVARMDSYGISEKIGYEVGKNDYSVRMSKYIPLSVDGQDLTVDENTGVYTYTVEYDGETGRIPVSSSVNFELEIAQGSAGEWYGMEEVLTYDGTGTVTATVGYNGNDKYKVYKDAVLKVNVIGSIKFEVDENRNPGSNVEVVADTNSGNLVEKVTVTGAANSWGGLKVTSDKDEQVAYEIDDEDKGCFSIDSASGVISFDKNRLAEDITEVSATVTAYYVGHEDVKASYELVYRMETENIEATLGNFQGNDIHVEYKQGDKYAINITNKANGVVYSYSSDSLSVANVDRYGNVEIKGAGSAEIKISGSNSSEWKKYTPYVFNLTLDKTEPYIVIKYGNDIIYPDNTDKIITIDDTEVVNDKISVPLSIETYKAYGAEGEPEELPASYKYGENYFTDNLVIEDADDIERNVDKEYTIVIEPVSGNYKPKEVTLKICLKGIPVDNSSIYTFGYVDENDNDNVNNLVEGRDGTRWAYTKEVKYNVVTATQYKLLSDESGGVVDYVEITVAGPEKEDKEHNIYYCEKIGETNGVSVYSQRITAREYYGTDLANPEIKSASQDGNNSINTTSNGNYSVGDFTFTVSATDSDGHLYSAGLFYYDDNGNSVRVGDGEVKDELSDGTTAEFTFTIHADRYAGISMKDLYVRVYDKANRHTDKPAGQLLGLSSNDFLIDATAPSAAINLVEEGFETADLVVGNENRYFVSGNVPVRISASEPETGEGKTGSGINRIEVRVNDEEAETIHADSDTLDSLLEDFEPAGDNGKYVITAVAYDNAGRKSEAATCIVYKDDKAPGASFESIDGTGSNFAYGNFYRTETVLKVNVSDTGSGVAKAELKVGDATPLEGTMDDDGVARFRIPLGLSGDASVTVTDKLGNSDVWTLTELNSVLFKSNLILSEDAEPQVTVEPRNASGDSGWYNDNVEFSIKAEENTEIWDVMSGIHSVRLYVNDIEYDTEYIYENDTTFGTDAYTVIVDRNIVRETECPDGSYTVKAVVTDNAGNEGTAEYRVKVDLEKPEAEMASADASGSSNITGYGNFYQKNVTYTLHVSDAVSGVKEAYMYVGDTEYGGTVQDGKAVFTVPLNVTGKITFYVTDNAENTGVFTLSGIKKEAGGPAFTSDLIVTENILPKISIAEQRAANENGWYNSGLNVDISVSEPELSSGLSSVKTYINGDLYDEKDYNDAMSKTAAFTAVISPGWVDRVINAAGTYTVKVVAEDNSGNVSEKEKTYKIDLVKPVIGDITGVVEGSNNAGMVAINVPVSEKHFNEKGNVTTINISRELDGQAVTSVVTADAATSADSIRHMSFTEDGTYSITVESTDAAGNRAESRSIWFVLDNTDPIVSVSGVEEGSYVTDAATVKFSVIESNYKDDNVTIEAVRTAGGTREPVPVDTFINSGKNSTLVRTFSTEGYYEITITATDGSGNAAKMQSLHFTVDTADPAVVIDGLSDRISYADEVYATVSISDTYYLKHSIVLKQSAVVNREDSSLPQIINAEDVTDRFITEVSSGAKGYTGIISIPKKQVNDGLYELTVTAQDLAGRVSTQTVNFTVNRFGSVFVLDRGVIDFLDNPYTQELPGPIKITEYNASEVSESDVNVMISKDGSLLRNPSFTFKSVKGDSSWYRYEYTIDETNFADDGIYRITLSSKDAYGNLSETIKDDKLGVVFCVDTTRPELVSVVGLEKKNYNATDIGVSYEIFDAIGIKSVEVYVNGVKTEEVTDAETLTQYLGAFSITEGAGQHIRIVITDMAGNVTDTDSKESSEYVAAFNDTVTVSTNFFVRWYADRRIFIGSLAGAAAVIAGVITLVMVRRKKFK